MAAAILTLPAGSQLNAGNYPNGISASYSDAASNDFASANAVGDVAVAAAATTTTITSPTVSSTYNSSNNQQTTLTATVANVNGGGVNEGVVTFTATNPNGANLTTTGNVSNGVASATLTVPAGFAAGSYSFTASYADSNNVNGIPNYAISTAASSGSLTVKTANSQTSVAVTPDSLAFSSNGQTVTVTATATSTNGGTVKEGNITFTLNGIPPLTVAVNSSGQVSATLNLPANFSAGNYILTATYSDSTNANGTLNVAASSGAATLSVAPAPTSVGFVGLVFEEIQLTVDTIFSEVEGLLGMPHASLDAAIAQFQMSIPNDALFSSSQGQLAVSLGQNIALSALSGSPAS